MMVRAAVTHDVFGMASWCARSARGVSKNMRERREADGDSWNELFDTRAGFAAGVSRLSQKRADTVGQPQSTEMGVPNMLSLKAKKLRKLLQAKVLLER